MEQRQTEYKRWYDEDKKLSIVVKAMEAMDITTQLKFADKLLELSRELLRDRGGDKEVLEALEADKKAALEKAQSRRRWYDQYESLHQAFNNLYVLNEQDRGSLANRLVVPVQIVEGYERSCREKGDQPNLEVVDEILRTSLLEGPERANKLYDLYALEASISPQQKSKPKGVWSEVIASLQKALST